jgi:predicted phosphodiesterase
MTHPLKIWLLALLCLPWGCDRPAPTARDQPMDITPATPVVHLIAVGDTGQPGAPLDDVRRAIAAEPRKDAILALGDLIYFSGPRCPAGRAQGLARLLLERHLGDPLTGLGAPALLALGNHDVNGSGRDRAREDCLLDFAAQEPDLHLPALTYKVDIGQVRLVVINTNHLTPQDGARARAWLERAQGPTVIVGHHTLRTYGDKEDEDLVLPWLRAHGLRPDLYVHGHAHLLQVGVYEGIFSVTSGAGSKLRSGPTCPPDCGPGQLWGRSTYGYSLIQVSPDQIKVQLKDRHGATLWETTRPLSRGAARQ